jgi:hypothetical protein
MGLIQKLYTRNLHCNTLSRGIKTLLRCHSQGAKGGQLNSDMISIEPSLSLP